MAIWPSNSALLLFIILSLHNCIASAQIEYPPEVQVATTWTISPSMPPSSPENPFYFLQVILLNQKENAKQTSKRASRVGFACGFYSNSPYEGNDSFFFVIGAAKILSNQTSGNEISDFQVLWSANRNRPVSKNATLQFLANGNLVLRDSDGTLVWSTNTPGGSKSSVYSMNLMKTGNLVINGRNNQTLWQSFDHPTDTLLPGQKLKAGQKLVAGISQTNRYEGSYYLSVTSQGMFVFYRVNNVPQMYLRYPTASGKMESIELNYVNSMSDDGVLGLQIWVSPFDQPHTMSGSEVHNSSMADLAYVKLDPDGHLRLYSGSGVFDLLGGVLTPCDYPTACGNFGVCSNGGECSCLPQFEREGEKGCSEISPPTVCGNAKSNYSLLTVEDIHSFNHVDPASAVLRGTDVESCKDACLRNCSCKVAIFHSKNISYGSCFIPLPVLSLIHKPRDQHGYVSYAFVKISSGRANGTHSPTSFGRHKIILVTAIGGPLLLVGFALVFWLLFCKQKNNRQNQSEDYLDELSELPIRFTYEELKIATGNFQKKIGEGGFGSVFEGTLPNGDRIAVKRLDSLNQGKKEFLAEVKTIGSIHHMNLVRLIGFGTETFHGLLVYERMCNGSLDKWIFHGESVNPPLDWQTRRSIILDIARGLAYLHEECRWKIVHLDIKPQNILLDAGMHAKICDFGLSTLIDKEKSQVVTTMRGTPGYLAPELYDSVITAKADVFSFGVVVMEVVCGRKNLDKSQPKQRMHLLPIFMKKAEENQLVDMVDNCSEDMQLNRFSVVEMMRVAIWCMQCDYATRPNMSAVVKVLENDMVFEASLDYNIYSPTATAGTGRAASSATSASLLPSILSAPR